MGRVLVNTMVPVIVGLGFFFQLGAEPGGASKVDEDKDLPLDADKDVPVEAGSFVMGPACRRYDA